MVKRKGFVVFFKEFDLNKYNNINITYLSKKMNYAVCYCDFDYYNNTVNKLKNNKNIIDIEESMFEMQNFDFNL